MRLGFVLPLLAAAIAPAQIITSFAGNGTAGFSGDNGAATQAQLNRVVGLATDAAGNVYLADQNNNVIRKVNSNGVITTFAGTTVAGFTGDGGPATQATLNGPTGVCVAPSGDVYVNDLSNRRVRKVAAATGIISTIASRSRAQHRRRRPRDLRFHYSSDPLRGDQRQPVYCRPGQQRECRPQSGYQRHDQYRCGGLRWNKLFRRWWPGDEGDHVQPDGGFVRRRG